MNREIKFRAWDNVSYMSKPFTLGDIQKGKIEFTDDATVMQYTGLKDKNGKEVYEGDVVKYRNLNNTPDRVGRIRILGGGTTANALETKVDTTDGYIYPLSNELEFPVSKSEVIGNIYENFVDFSKDK